MKLETQDDQLMALAAFRYCLGRRSYIVGSAIEWLRSTWPQLDANTQGVILRDIVEAIIHKYVDDSMVVGGWSAFCKWAWSQINDETRAWLLRAVSYMNEPDLVTDILGIDK